MAMIARETSVAVRRIIVRRSYSERQHRLGGAAAPAGRSHRGAPADVVATSPPIRGSSRTTSIASGRSLMPRPPEAPIVHAARHGRTAGVRPPPYPAGVDVVPAQPTGVDVVPALPAAVDVLPARPPLPQARRQRPPRAQQPRL